MIEDWMQKSFVKILLLRLCAVRCFIYLRLPINSLNNFTSYYHHLIYAIKTLFLSHKTAHRLNKHKIYFYLMSQSKATPRWTHNVDGLSEFSRKDVMKFKFVRFTILYTGHSYIVDVNGTGAFTAKMWTTGIILYNTLFTASARTPFLRSQLAPSRYRPCT